MTVVFTDLEGFTAYTDVNGDAAAIALIAEHHDLAGTDGPPLERPHRQAPR